MKEERLCSPTDLATRVAALLADIADPELPIPSEAELTMLVEATFFASLHEEEARHDGFNVAWQPESHGCISLVALTTLVRATPRNLAKLAPATHRDATSIAVRREGADLVAWALFEQNASLKQPLTIRALDAGVLRIDYAGVPRALYTRGEMYLATEANAIKSPSRLLTRTFAQWAASADPRTGIEPRAAVVARLAARALDHGHGGMILVIPAEVSNPIGVRIHYPVSDGALILERRFEDVIRDVPHGDRIERLRGSRPRGPDGRVSVRDEAQIAFAEAIELVARLTAIDNAVLLDTDLRLRGFGTQVLEGEAPQMTFEHADPYSGDLHVDDIATFKGTRHPAGVVFCMRQSREAAAIIASQDGRLSLALKNAVGVKVVGSYEHAFGWL